MYPEVSEASCPMQFQGTRRSGNEFHSAIGSYMALGQSMLGKDVEMKSCASLLRHDGIVSWDEELLL